MAKRETIEQFAKREASEEQERAEQREFFKQNALKLAEEMPNHFFDFVATLRKAVGRFNDNCDPEKRMTWFESTSVATRDPNPNADFYLRFERGDQFVNVRLNALGRSGKPPVFLIDLDGKVGKDDVFMARVEGQVREKKILFRATLNFKKLKCTLEEFADRLVLAVVKRDYEELLDDEERKGF